MLTLPPLSLYIHVPWCVRKCPYCDFNSHALTDENIPEEEYINSLLADFQEELGKIQGRELVSIFIGGGTPSLLSSKCYQRLLKEIKEYINFSCDIEITLEVNPGACEHDRFQGYFEAGINRFSLGVQSFQNEKLKAIGRIHSAEEAIMAVTSLSDLGFSNVNIDLMHGLPGQTKDDALYDLKTAIDLSPAHISWYQLTIEPNTFFYSNRPVLPVDDTLWSIQAAGQALLAECDYQQYEISAYSQPGRQSRHNLNYWKFGDYIGIGAGAHGKWSCKDSGEIYRNWKTRMPKDYLSPRKPFQAGQRLLSLEERPLEFMMNVLRLHQGVSPELYVERTGLPLVTLDATWSLSRKKGLMVSERRLAPSAQGRLFLNDLLALFA